MFAVVETCACPNLFDDLENILGKKGCNCSEMVFKNSSWQPQVTEGVLRGESLAVLKEYFGKHDKN